MKFRLPAAPVEEPGEYGLAVLIYGAIGAGVGALTGYIVGSRKHRALIYETR